MTISLTCACGVHLEVDETFAGKTITCPDCQRSLVAPKPEPPGMQTSGFALASLTVALLGAFTILGTLAAIVLGWLGLRAIKESPDKLAGRNYALAGIVLGVVLTLFTLYAVTLGKLFGLGNLFHRVDWVGQLDYDVPDEIERRTERFAITRPSRKWGVARNPSQGQLDVGHVWDELRLVNPEADAVLLVWKLPVGLDKNLETCRDDILRDYFQDHDKAGFFGKKRVGGPRGRTELIRRQEAPDPPGTMHGLDLEVAKSVGQQERRFLVRILKEREDRDGDVFVIIGGARKSRFARVEEEITKGIKSFRLLDRVAP